MLESHGLEPAGARRTAEAHRELTEARKSWLERLLAAVRMAYVEDVLGCDLQRGFLQRSIVKPAAAISQS